MNKDDATKAAGTGSSDPPTKTEGAKAIDNRQRKTAPRQAPSIGRIVHYIDREEALHAASVNTKRAAHGDDPVEITPHAATITRLHDGDVVTLEVHHPELGPQIQRQVPFAETPTIGHWNWPVYVAPVAEKK